MDWGGWAEELHFVIPVHLSVINALETTKHREGMDIIACVCPYISFKPGGLYRRKLIGQKA